MSGDQKIRYQLDIRAEIRQVDARGMWLSSGTLTMSENVNLGVLNFLSVCAVLARLHELVDALRAEPEQEEK